MFSVREASLHGTDDRDLLRRAFEEERVILTHDSDFGALAIRDGEPLVGVVYLRPGHFGPNFTIRTLRGVFEKNLDLSPLFIMVAKQTESRINIRIRSLAL